MKSTAQAREIEQSIFKQNQHPLQDVAQRELKEGTPEA